MADIKKLLEGIRVLDLTQAYSGPFACMHLADQGAEVIKIEPPHGDQSRKWSCFTNEHSAYFAYINRNKKGVVLDLKTEEGKEALARLVRCSDIVIENFSAGTFKRLGFDYERLKELKEDIIYGQITGFGLSGPMSRRPAYDIVAQAEGGIMSVTGYPDGDPLKIGPSIADSYTGTYLALGVTMALFDRQRTGRGAHVNVSMTDTIFSILEAYVPEYTLTGRVPKRTGSRGLGNAPWNVFHAQDGEFVVGCVHERHWVSLCMALGLHDMIEDPKFGSPANRMAAVEELETRIQEVSRTLTLAELDERLSEAGVPFGKINTIAQIADSELIRSQNMLWSIYDPGLDCEFRMPGTPIKVSGRADEIVKAAPLLGEDSEIVLRELAGYSEREIEDLRARGVIL